MRKLLTGLTVLGVLGSLMVLAASPATAGGATIEIYVWGDGPVSVVAESACSTHKLTVPSSRGLDFSESRYISLDSNCDYTLYGVDPTGHCRVQGAAEGSSIWTSYNWKTQVRVGEEGANIESWSFRLSEDCIVPTTTIEIEKDIPLDDQEASALTTFEFVLAPWDLTSGTPKADGGPCTDRSTYSALGETDGDPLTVAAVEVVNAANIVDNQIQYCSYAVTELPTVGWTLLEVDSDEDCDEEGIELLEEATVILTPRAVHHDQRCEAEFDNSLDPVPFTVEKSFEGRDFYTTVDRADFHIFTPGSCGGYAIDPFGGLLGSAGVFRTINASQLPQVVLGLEHIDVASPDGPCTYRVQENNAPDGCVAVDPDGSDADGPYWEQTWVPGETTAFDFNIVNDCSDPEPTPTPTVAPTSDPHPGGKKPPGGTVAPKFTG